MSKRVNISMILAIFLLLGTTVTFAMQKRGEIHGKVHEDVNGDGLCIDTGVEGEGPISHIELEFVSSDESVVINLITGDDGTYGLVAAGQSNWRVTANPDSTKWVVTSEKTLYAAVFEETLVVTDINFCVQKVGTVTDGGTTTGGTTTGGTTTGGTSNAVIILPESGAARNTASLWLFTGTTLGLVLIGFGILLEYRRRKAL